MAIALLLTLAVAVFSAFPHLDLAIDNLFASPTTRFPVKDSAFGQAVRSLMILATDGLMAGAVVLATLSWVSPRFRVIKPHVLGFMVAVYVAIPGLLVNVGLKDHWGRARPRNIVDFGGTAMFSPPLEIADQCLRNCSFVSGEASALFTVATLLVLFFVPLLGPRLRAPAVGLIGAVAVFGSGLRVAFGAHFVSDVIFAALICTSATLILYRLAGMDRIGSPLAPRKGRGNP